MEEIEYLIDFELLKLRELAHELYINMCNPSYRTSKACQIYLDVSYRLRLLNKLRDKLEIK
jgi:hypothetical protein